MDLKEFVSKAITDIIQAVDKASENSVKEPELAARPDKRTIEFDIAVSAENTDTKSGKAGIRVLEFAEAGGNLSKETKNSTVSRIVFGIDVSRKTKEEIARQQRMFDSRRQMIERDEGY